MVGIGDVIQQRLLGQGSRWTQLVGPMRLQIDLLESTKLIRQLRDPLLAVTNLPLKNRDGDILAFGRFYGSHCGRRTDRTWLAQPGAY